MEEAKATYYNNKALALYHIGNLNFSLKEFNKAIELDPKDPRTLYNRGNTLLSLRFLRARQMLTYSA